MFPQISLLKFITVNTLVLMINTINTYARSINTENDNKSSSNENQSYIKVPSIVCIIGVVAVAASGGFCLFSSKKQKRMSEEYLTKPESNPSTNTNSPVSTNSELRELNPEVEEADIAIQVDKLDSEENENNSQSQNEEQTKKRKSILDTILNRNSKKEHRQSNVQFVEDRSLNSISTNEDWINEQKYQAELKNKDLEQDNLYEDEEVDSNDGFWNSDLEPIQSSSNNKQESYAVPSLGKRNSVIVKKNSEMSNSNGKRQSVIILDDDNKKVYSSGSSIGSSKSGDLRPTRVKSWKNNDLNKEIMEIMKNLENEDKLSDIKEVV